MELKNEPLELDIWRVMGSSEAFGGQRVLMFNLKHSQLWVFINGTT